ncbi:adenosylcobinamide-phosphate synthase CbiB [Draconibacterium sp. IB214405]|uniref:adenosylcobinamide-phosphate synthase CbiB n=1 Tax=Draconibacterium sp. IB214405 TaxID=3097352 RepID=UPI002A0B15F5|nr:adenosylcobinamide-phosphate synthase CbiB [Draconibacterium sp. IB214405]MDX8341074.1 adenosylcobinamide-phosphate synthase CbiB [Draconibacterium sp. IB214405]
MNEHLELVIPLLAGFALDCLIGDPHFLPHPIRLFGKVISVGVAKLNRGRYRKIKGAVLASFLILCTYLLFKLGLTALSAYQDLFLIASSILVFYGLANRSLIQESLRVIIKLENEGLEAGRQQLSMIVGRETTQLNKNKIRTAVLETLAENLSDGVIAPLFFYFIGGVPAMFAYKMANTLDSMIGYKNERYKDFGFFAAKLDDVLNFIPARLTAVIMAIVSFKLRAIKFIFKYGSKHSSTNAGYPEAALAGILNCRFGGPNRYHGVLVNKPFIGMNPRPVSANDVYKACVINVAVTLVFIGVFILWLV